MQPKSSLRRSFLKWPGNKFRIIPEIVALLPKGSLLIEPFVGSGSVFLNTDYEQYLLNDVNFDLINIYQILQREGETFIQHAKQYFTPRTNQENTYYDLRAQFNALEYSWERAALFLYLNRHGFNGLCRYNQSGYLNVPFGLYKQPYFPLEEMRFFHQKAQGVMFSSVSFEKSMANSPKSSVIYCDPPYVPLSKTASFISYSQYPFGLKEQLKLLELVKKISKKNRGILISNHDTPLTRQWYQEAIIKRINVSRVISCKAANRKPAKELLALFVQNA